MPYIAALALTLTYSALTLVFFRTSSIAAALAVLKADFLGSQGASSITYYPYLAFVLLGLVHWTWHKYSLEQKISHVPALAFTVGTGVAFALFFSITPREILPFIYFQF